MRARDVGLACGMVPTGGRNSIADVPDVTVGHVTLAEGNVLTGVTAILPHAGDPWLDRPLAAAFVLNGFGKSVGLMQVNEVGSLETPVLLTNTFSVGTCANALIRRAVRAHPAIGRQAPTVNPVVLECNDGYLNNIQAMAVTEAHAEAAIAAAAPDFANGAVGAGTGMSCFGLKGGVGSASRRLELDGVAFHLGALVLANFGRPGDLRLPDGRRIDPGGGEDETSPFSRGGGNGGGGQSAGRPMFLPESGSCIIILATDVPLEHRQLQRVASRAGVGLAWCGSFWGHGSGDIALAFTTANRMRPGEAGAIVPLHVLREERMDLLFQAAAEATQEAVLDALAGAGAVVGREGHRRIGLRDLLQAR
jgi:D-aminopeptidase